MSMQLFVLFAGQDAPDLEAWANALSARDLPLSITEKANLETHTGFLPMQLDGEDTGLYFHVADYRDLAAQIPPLKEITIEDPVVWSLGFGSPPKEGLAVFYSAAALTSELNGVAFEPQGGAFMNAYELLEAARQIHQMAATHDDQP